MNLYGGDRRQLVNDVMQWAMFLLAVFANIAIFSGKAGPAIGFVMALLAALAVLAIVFRHRWFRVPRVIHDVITEYRIEDNRAVWAEVRDSYCYFGISGHTMSLHFREFINRNPFRKSAKLRFLLAEPYSNCVKKSKSSELANEATMEQVEEGSRLIEGMARFYSRSLTEPRVEVRFYKEYHGYWAHIVNGDNALVGHYLKGQDGLKALVLHLKKGPHGNALFQFYKEEFDRLWEEATPVETYFAKQATAGERT